MQLLIAWCKLKFSGAGLAQGKKNHSLYFNILNNGSAGSVLCMEREFSGLPAALGR